MAVVEFENVWKVCHVRRKPICSAVCFFSFPDFSGSHLKNVFSRADRVRIHLIDYFLKLRPPDTPAFEPLPLYNHRTLMKSMTRLQPIPFHVNSVLPLQSQLDSIQTEITNHTLLIVRKLKLKCRKGKKRYAINLSIFILSSFLRSKIPLLVKKSKAFVRNSTLFKKNPSLGGSISRIPVRLGLEGFGLLFLSPVSAH